MKLRYLLLAGSFLLATDLAVAAPAGAFDSVSGDVTVTAPGKPPVKVAPGEVFDSGARITTGAGAAANLKFADQQVVELKPNTEFAVSNYSFDPAKPAEGNATFNFLRGGMRLITGLIGKSNPSKFSLRTPTATAGVRGTVFTAESDGTNDVFMVTEGTIVVTRDGTSQTVTAPTGVAVSTPQGIQVFSNIADAKAAFPNLAALIDRANADTNTSAPSGPAPTQTQVSNPAGAAGSGGGGCTSPIGGKNTC